MTETARVWPKATALLTALVSSVLALIFLFRLEVWLEDYVVTTQAGWADPQDIVVVTITEDTLATLKYRSPIDRGFLADVVARLDEAGAKAIGIDILIDQFSEREKDARFLKVLENASADIVVGYADAADGLTEKQVTYLDAWTRNLSRGLVTLNRDDFDGAIRQANAGRSIGDKPYLGLAAALARQAGTTAAGPTGRISYYSKADGTPFGFPTYPAHSVRLIPKEWFNDKIVLIGSALPTADLHRTPFSTTIGTQAGSLYGVIIHAHMLAQALQGDRIIELGAVASALVVFAFALAAALIAIMPARPLMRALLIAILLALLASGSLMIFQQSRVLIPVVTPAAAAIITALFLALREWRQDRAGRQFVENAFAQYVSPAVVRRIIARRESLILGGEVRRVTYVFTDLEGFTTMCEGLKPEQVAVLLNDYLDRMCALFIERDATIDKIIGDAVVGFFGAPEEQTDQCDRAIDLALAIDNFAENYKVEMRAKGFEFGTTRIGIHTGDAVVGNFGGSRFVDYTSIGDTVNSAARMEAANKHLGTRICVSEAVKLECPTRGFRPVGRIFLKGKHDEIACYEPLHPDRLPVRLLTAYHDAYSAMARGDEDAAASFVQLNQDFPDDPLAALHMRRLQGGEAGATIVMQEK